MYRKTKHCVNVWLASFARPCPFPSLIGFTIWSCSGSFTTTISNAPSVKSSHYPEMNFDGPVTFHSEYSGEPMDTVIDLARSDVRYIRGLLAAL